MARVRVLYNGKVVSVKIIGDVQKFDDKVDQFEKRIKNID